MSTLDASLLLAHFTTDDVHHGEATGFLAGHVEEEHFINPLTLAEVLVGPARAGMLNEAYQAVADLGINEQALPDDAAPHLARLRVQTGLKMPDCCVLVTARQTGTAVASFDNRLRRAAEALDIAVVPERASGRT